MNLKLKPSLRKTCGFCGNGFYPAPQVKEPRTCGRPDCLMGLRRLHKVRIGILSLPLPLYHRMLDSLKGKKLDREWFLVYLLGETGMLVSEALRIRPVDLFFDGAEKKILVDRKSVV